LPEEEPWKMIGYPIVDWDVLIQPDLLPIQISGMLIVILLSSLVYVSVNRQMRLASTVRQRTQEIVQINNSLEQRVAARTRELTTLLEVSQKVATSPDIQPLLSLILDRVEGVVTCTAATIFLKEDDQNLSLLTYRGPMSREELPNLWSFEGAEHYQEVLRSLQTVIISDVRTDDKLATAWRRTMKQHLGETPDYILSWMGVPLLVRKRVIGLLVFHHHVANYYSIDQANIASAFAQQAALAIENTRLYEQAQQVAILRERQRLARDLHDSVSQALYSVALGARAAQKIVHQQLGDETRNELSEPIDHILTMAEAGLAEMRALIFELRPETLENEGLISALTKQITAIRARHGLEIEVSLCEEPDLSMDLKLLIYRLTQETLNNIIKHAKASRIDFKLICMKDKVNLTIRDNGQGFDTTVPSKGLGLRSMRERVEQVNGRIKVISEPNRGTTISVLIPIE
jgi:signal transduction histidine kinase